MNTNGGSLGEYVECAGEVTLENGLTVRCSAGYFEGMRDSFIENHIMHQAGVNGTSAQGEVEVGLLWEDEGTRAAYKARMARAVAR